MPYYDSTTKQFNKSKSIITSDEYAMRNRAIWIMSNTPDEVTYYANKAIVDSLHNLWLGRNARVMTEEVNTFWKWHRGFRKPAETILTKGD
jgi:hypothetical protein